MQTTCFRAIARHLALSVRSAAAVAVAVLLLPACQITGPAPAGQEDVDLLEPLWVLVNMDGRPVPEGDFTVAFGPEGMLNVRSDCNTCHTSYELGTGLSMSIGPLGCTRAYCGPDSRDTAFNQALSEAASYEIEGGRLRIIHDGGRVLIFEAAEQPDAVHE